MRRSVLHSWNKEFYRVGSKLAQFEIANCPAASPGCSFRELFLYLTSRYATILLQLLDLAPQNNLSAISSLVAGEASGAGRGNVRPRDRNENAPRVWSVVLSHWVS